MHFPQIRGSEQSDPREEIKSGERIDPVSCSGVVSSVGWRCPLGQGRVVTEDR